MDGLVAVFDGVVYLLENLHRQPVVHLLRFYFMKLLPGKGGILWVANEVCDYEQKP